MDEVEEADADGSTDDPDDDPDVVILDVPSFSASDDGNLNVFSSFDFVFVMSESIDPNVGCLPHNGWNLSYKLFNPDLRSNLDPMEVVVDPSPDLILSMIPESRRSALDPLCISLWIISASVTMDEARVEASRIDGNDDSRDEDGDGGM